MAKQYFIECDKCQHEVEFNEDDVPELSDHIDACVAQAEREVERQYEGMIDPDDLPITPQTMKELAAAIRCGDRAEGERLLDLIADDLGLMHTEAVQIGRYTPAVARVGS